MLNNIHNCKPACLVNHVEFLTAVWEKKSGLISSFSKSLRVRPGFQPPNSLASILSTLLNHRFENIFFESKANFLSESSVLTFKDFFEG